MNRDDIIRMAREAGIPETATEGVFIANSDDLGRLIAAEREACAKVAEEMGNISGNMNKTWRNGCFDAAFAIRERGAPALERLNKAAEDNGEEL
jgi:hypothetical protein